MKVKIEFDVGEAVRLSQNPVYDTISQIFDGLESDISEPGAFEGDVSVYAWDHQIGKRVPNKVGSWGIE